MNEVELLKGIKELESRIKALESKIYGDNPNLEDTKSEEIRILVPPELLKEKSWKESLERYKEEKKIKDGCLVLNPEEWDINELLAEQE